MDIVSLAQVHNSEPDAHNYWYTAEDLNLGGYFYDLWNNYIAGLNSAGIRLAESDDELIWDFKKKNGSISARNAYDCIVSSSCGAVISPVDKFLWNNTLPNKISCFIWLAVRNRILTWENLQKKGKQGPGICVLCKNDEETTEHIFTKCIV